MWELDCEEGCEHRRIEAFDPWCWRRLLRVPWNARRSNQSILKEISPGCSLEGLMLKLKLQYFGHLCEELTHWKRPWWLERLKTGEVDNRMRWLDGITDSMNMNEITPEDNERQGSPWSRKGFYTTEQLNGNNKHWYMNLASCLIAIIFISFLILSGL